MQTTPAYARKTSLASTRSVSSLSQDYELQDIDFWGHDNPNLNLQGSNVNSQPVASQQLPWNIATV